MPGGAHVLTLHITQPQDVHDSESRRGRLERDGRDSLMPLTTSQAEYLEGLSQLAASEAAQADWLARWLSIAVQAHTARREDHAPASRALLG